MNIKYLILITLFAFSFFLKGQEVLFEDDNHVIHFELDNDSVKITIEDLNDFSLDHDYNLDSSLFDYVIIQIDQNQSGTINLNQNIDLSKHQINTLLPNDTYFWRFRYRDKGLNWSSWSEVESFKTDSAFLNWNLYPNPVKENAVLHIPYTFDNKFDVLI